MSPVEGNSYYDKRILEILEKKTKLVNIFLLSILLFSAFPLREAQAKICVYEGSCGGEG